MVNSQILVCGIDIHVVDSTDNMLVKDGDGSYRMWPRVVLPLKQKFASQ